MDTQEDQRMTCKKCKLIRPITHFYPSKKIKKDGSPVNISWCIPCKTDYNNNYMRMKREDPEFREKEKKYQEGRHTRRYQSTEQ